MSVIDQVTAHYAANRQQHIDVPEWGVDGVPLRIYWDLLTVDKRKKIFANEQNSDVDTVVAMACDEQGNKMFDLADKAKLKVAADSALLTRIARKMIGIDRISEAMVEAAVKN
ncbi:MAG TPA: hypothetical protein VIH40_13820 [Xanthobacteraceae bacterium]